MLTSCGLTEFPLREDGLEVQRHVLRGCLKQFRDLGLRQPECFPLKAALDSGTPVLRLVQENAALRWFLV